jgi:hypothetical protein
MFGVCKQVGRIITGKLAKGEKDEQEEETGRRGELEKARRPTH